MKKKLACVLLLFSFAEVAYARVCFDGRIKQITVGGIASGPGDPDNGNAIRVVTSGDPPFPVDTYPVDYQLNLNDKQGVFMLQQLTTAFLGDFKLVGFDNWNNLCDKINQITLKN